MYLAVAAAGGVYGFLSTMSGYLQRTMAAGLPIQSLYSTRIARKLETTSSAGEPFAASCFFIGRITAHLKNWESTSSGTSSGGLSPGLQHNAQCEFTRSPPAEVLLSNRNRLAVLDQ